VTVAAGALEPRAAAGIADDLALLARLHDRELDAPLIAILRRMPVDQWFALRLEGPEFTEAARLLDDALKDAPDPVTAETLDEMAAEYAAIYLNHTYRISPHESVWVDDDGLERQEPMFRVRAAYAEFGFRVPDWRMRADDHIAHELAFLSNVAPRLAEPAAAEAIARFLREHPRVWLPEFAGRVARRCQSPFYAGIALMTTIYVSALADLLAQIYGFDPTPVEPQKHAQAAPGLTCADPPPRYAPGAGPGW
jgi:TorA maturation chaperone TorD